ncbi:hypothetical protein [Renibacterium salmoninarum]|nr:hypothetical protein [Renibacterium salmoninarum]
MEPGQDAIVRGMGLAFIDLIVLLMQGRGGRFSETSEGLRYLPSGEEPRLFVGSRRGVPYRSKPIPILRGEPASVRYLTPSAVAELLSVHSTLDFESHLRPLMVRELAYGHYREIGTGHPHRLKVPWSELQSALDRNADPLELSSMLKDPQDLLDLDTLAYPLRGADVPDLQHWMAQHIETDVQKRTDDLHSESFGLFLAILGCHGVLSGIPLDRLSPASAQAISGTWHSFFSYLASGPPPARLRELLALQKAGLVHFLGADLEVRSDEATGRFIARSASSGVAPVSTDVLIDAFLPSQTVAVTVDSQSRVLAENGQPVPGRFALGPFTSAVKTRVFSRPRSNAPGFRENDALARQLLEFFRVQDKSSALDQAAVLRISNRPSHAVTL